MTELYMFIQGGAWCWIVVGWVLVGAEMILPGVFFLWIGGAAIVVGTVSVFIPMTPEFQFVLLAILAPVMMMLGKTYFKTHVKSDHPLLNDRSKQMIGRIIVLNNSLVNGRAQVAIGDSVWMVEMVEVEGPDLEAGAHVKIVDVEGNTLKIKSSEEESF